MKPKHSRQGGMLGKAMVAVFALSPAMAFSDDTDYTVRERVSAGLNVAGAAQNLVTDNMRKSSADYSRGWTSQELSGLNFYLHSIRIDPETGVITINYTEQAKKVSISLTPSAGGEGLAAGKTPMEDISWRCTVSDPSDNKYVPDHCRM